MRILYKKNYSGNCVAVAGNPLDPSVIEAIKAGNQAFIEYCENAMCKGLIQSKIVPMLPTYAPPQRARLRVVRDDFLPAVRVL